MLLTLLPLAGWAETIIDNEFDVTVKPSDASDVVWSGVKPTVQAGWLIVESEAPTKPTKAQVADQIEVVDLADYNIGNHTYVLKLKTGAAGYVDIPTGVEDHVNRYYLHTNAQNTATLTITKFTGAPVFTTTDLAFVGGDLVYTGEAQALLSGGATATANGFTVPVVYATSAEATTWVPLAQLTEINANTTGYTVYYKVVGTDNYAGSEVQTMVGEPKVIAKATQNFAAEGAAPTANTWTYDATAHALVIAPTSPVANGTYEYCATDSANDEDWTTDPTTITGTSNTGNKTVYWRVKDTENYKGNAASSLTATINKATPVLNVDGVINTAWNLYDGANHNLFLKRATATIGETTLGTDAIYYNARYKAPGGSYGSWFTEKTSPTNSNFTNKKDAGSYQVQIWVAETADYNAVYHKPNNQFVRIDVAKADITGYTEPVAKTGLRANGTHALVEAATWGENTPAGTFAYSLNGTDWVADVPTASVADDYTVYFKMTPTDATNYNVFTNSYAVSIAAANPAYIIPVAKSKMYGQSTDPELTYTVVDGDGNALEKTVLKGTVNLARELGNAVGQYIIYVMSYEPGENEVYDVLNVTNDPHSTNAANKTAFFSIIADPNNTLKLKFTAAAVATKVYDGTTAVAFDNDDLEIESGALGTDTWATLKNDAHITFALKTTEGAAPANANVGNYQVVATYSDGLVNYANVEIAPLAYTITKKQLAVVVEDQTVNYGVAIASEEGVNWNLATGSAYVAGEDNDDAGIVLYTAQAINKYEPGSENAAAIMAKIEGDSNYEIAAEGNTWGKLTINAGAALVLNSNADDLDKINAFDGLNVNVSIDFTARNGRNLGGTRDWVKENWVTLTLPFDISVADLSKALGYAIVNVIDDSKTKVNGTSSEFYGKLTMKGGNGKDDVLAANKPFLVKIADDIVSRNGGVINFGEQTIVAPASADDLTVNAGQGAKFVGTYASKPVSSADDANIWFMIGGGYTKWAYIMSTSAATWTIAPFEAYIDMSANPGVQAMTFYFEEIDGTATAIKSVNADNLNGKIAEGMYNMNGMKMNSVPTQKGVYIINGKKVVIK